MTIRQPGEKPDSAKGSEEAAVASSMLLLVVSGLIISLYALGLSYLLPHSNANDQVDQAALLCARRLARVSIKDAEFGTVALADSTADGDPVRSLNSLYATLRVDACIARSFSLPQMEKLIEHDYDHLHQVEGRLTAALSQQVAVDAAAFTQSSNSIYSQAWSELSRVRGEKLLNLHLRLGSAYGNCNSGIKANGEPDSALTTDGCYKALSPVPINRRDNVFLYQLPAQPQLFAGTDYRAPSAEVAPSAVLVEATYENLTRGFHDHNPQRRTISACALVGSKPQDQSGGSLLLSFPHGLPSSLNTMEQLLHSDSDVEGDWAQAKGGSVPGQGRLVPRLHGENTATVSQACQTGFYHYLRSLGPSVSIRQTARLLTLPFPRADETDTRAWPMIVNSALVKETGARRFSFLNQTGPGEPAQEALHDAFAGEPMADNLPPSAVPLQVTPKAGCHLSGRNSFRRSLIDQFLGCLYRTNMSAVESACVASLVQDRMSQAIKQTNNECYMQQEELYSLNSRLGRAMSGSEPATASQLRAMRKTQTRFMAVVKQLKDKVDDYERIRNKCEIVLNNARYAGKTTFDVCARMSSFARNGIFASQSPDGYLLDTNVVFTPADNPVSEVQLYSKQQPPESGSSWMSAHFTVLRPVSASTTIDGKPAAQIDRLRFIENPSAKFFLIGGKDLANNHPISYLTLNQTPFGNTGITEGQLAYYAVNAFTAGDSPKVGWSVLLRDLAFARSPLQAAGISLPGFLTAYTQPADSGLLLEIQVRSPVPLLPDLPVGSYLVDPDTQKRVPQIPPIPPRML